MKWKVMLRKPYIRFIMIVMIVIGFGILMLRPWETEDAQETTTPQAESAANDTPYWETLPPTLPTVDVTNLAPEAIDMENAKVFPSLTYGLHAFFWWDSSYRNVGLDHLNQMQFSHIRQKFAWADLEPIKKDLPKDDPDRYVWAEADAMMNDIEAKGIQVVARLGTPPDWAIVSSTDYQYAKPPFDMERLVDYCSAMATRYKGRIVGYQIWNEPNLNREWGYYSPNPSAFVKLLAACAEAIREADPDAIIISAGLAPTETRDSSVMPHLEFLWKMYAAGASPYFDVLGVHAPGYRSAPEDDPFNLPTGDHAWMSFRHVEYMRAVMVANGDAAKQIAITEMGWTTDQINPTYSWFAVTPEVQGDYLARAYAYAAQHWRPWMGLMITIYYPNPAWTEANEEYWWAIGTVAPLPYGMDGRPAWAALWRMRKISTDPAYNHPARDEYGNPLPEDESL